MKMKWLLTLLVLPLVLIPVLLYADALGTVAEDVGPAASSTKGPGSNAPSNASAGAGDSGNTVKSIGKSAAKTHKTKKQTKKAKKAQAPQS